MYVLLYVWLNLLSLESVVLTFLIVFAILLWTEGGGSDPKFNVQLARVIDQANKDDVPKTTIENAIKSAVSGYWAILNFLVRERVLNLQ